ncbi:MAG: hypothetical protein QME70_10740 [Bacillota bacterium]|nr:hypothetical protein [Bacillota bacterium]
MRQGGYLSVLLAAVLALAVATAAFGVHQVGVASRRAFALDLDTAQARLAADAGVERILRYLAAHPAWSDGRVAVGPVGDRAAVEEVNIEREGDVVTVTSVGVSGQVGPVRKTVTVRLRLGLVPLVGAYGGGVKALGGTPLEALGSAALFSGLLVSGGLSVGGSARVGSDSEPRKVYVSGDIYSQQPAVIWGSAYATGTVSPGAATGENVSGWTPLEEFPDIGRVAGMVELGRLQARLLEAATGVQHYFPGDRTFTAADLASMEGVYFVEGTAYVSGGSTSARASLVSGGDIVLYGSLDAPRVSLVAGEDVVTRDSSAVHVALIVAGGDVGWGGTGGGSGGFRMEYGALAAATVNGNRLRGNITLEQDDEVDFGLVSGPVHVAQILERTGD